MSAIRVVVADDHPVVIEGLSRCFASRDDVELRGHCHDASGLSRLDLTDIDVVVLDVGMPGMFGVELVETLRARGVPVLLFTLEPESPEAIALLRAGAAGIVSKSESVDDLVMAIASVARGERHVPPRLEARVARSTETWPHDALSEREQAIFSRLIRGVLPKEIGFELGLSTSTVYTYAERVRHKIGVSGQTELVEYAHRAGLLGHGVLSLSTKPE